MTAGNAAIDIAVAAYYPTLTLSAEGGFESSSLGNRLSDEQTLNGLQVQQMTSARALVQAPGGSLEAQEDSGSTAPVPGSVFGVQ